MKKPILVKKIGKQNLSLNAHKHSLKPGLLVRAGELETNEATLKSGGKRLSESLRLTHLILILILILYFPIRTLPVRQCVLASLLAFAIEEDKGGWKIKSSLSQHICTTNQQIGQRIAGCSADCSWIHPTSSRRVRWVAY